MQLLSISKPYELVVTRLTIASSNGSSINTTQTTNLTVTAIFSDGTSKAIVPDSITATYGSFGTLGNPTTYTPPVSVTNTQSVIITANYTFQGRISTTSITLNVYEIMATGLVLTCANGTKLKTQQVTQLTAKVSFNDGTTKNVIPSTLVAPDGIVGPLGNPTQYTCPTVLTDTRTISLTCTYVYKNATVTGILNIDVNALQPIASWSSSSGNRFVEYGQNVTINGSDFLPNLPVEIEIVRNFDNFVLIPRKNLGTTLTGFFQLSERVGSFGKEQYKFDTNSGVLSGGDAKFICKAYVNNQLVATSDFEVVTTCTVDPVNGVYGSHPSIIIKNAPVNTDVYFTSNSPNGPSVKTLLSGAHTLNNTGALTSVQTVGVFPAQTAVQSLFTQPSNAPGTFIVMGSIQFTWIPTVIFDKNGGPVGSTYTASVHNAPAGAEISYTSTAGSPNKTVVGNADSLGEFSTVGSFTVKGQYVITVYANDVNIGTSVMVGT